MTISKFLSFAEIAVRWINLVLVLSGLALCAFLSSAFFWPDPKDPHGGVYQLLGALIIMPATLSGVVTWFSMRRRASWRWWAQLLPFAMFFGVVQFDTLLMDSVWIYSFVIGLPLIAAGGYGFFGRRSLKQSSTVGSETA